MMSLARSLGLFSDNRNSVLDQLRQLSADGSQLTATDVNLAMDTVDKALAQAGTMDDTAALRSTVSVLSNLIDADGEVLEEANSLNKSISRSVIKALHDFTSFCLLTVRLVTV